MKQKMLFSWIAVIALFIMGVGSADVISGWNGTWFSEKFERQSSSDDGKLRTYLPFDPMSGIRESLMAQSGQMGKSVGV